MSVSPLVLSSGGGAELQEAHAAQKNRTGMMSSLLRISSISTA